MREEIREEDMQDEIRFKISGMTCDSCAIHVTRALKSVKGVISVTLPGWTSKYATVVVKSGVSEKELSGAVSHAGYKAIPESRKADVERLVVPVAKKKGDYDVAVIGTGGAGMAAAIRAAELGYKVALVEESVVGGTCVNIGCVPSKTLIHASNAYYRARKNPFDGVKTAAQGLDWRTVISEKTSMINALRKEKYLDVINAYQSQITLIQAHARLTGKGEVTLDNGETLTVSKIIVATGARPRILPIDGISETEVLTSTSIMELDQLPISLIVLGGRSIALELGQAFSRFGTEVIILQRSQSIIPEHEPELAKALDEYLDDENIRVVTDVRVKSIKDENGIKSVKAEVEGVVEEFRAEHILMATGRTPNTKDLGLNEVCVELDDRGFIIVDATMRTSNSSIYAAGDVTTLPKFVYVAAVSGGIAAENALRNTNREIELIALPEIIFTSPQVATVGLTEKKAKEAGYEVKVSILPLKHVPRAIAERNTRGLIKLVADKKSNQLLGAHVLAEDAGEVIQTATFGVLMAHRYGMTLTDLQQMFFPYLVQVEGIKLASLAFDKDVSKLSCCAG